MKNGRFLIGILIILIMAAFLSACGRGKTDEVTGATWEDGLPEQNALAVDARLVSSGRLIPSITASGIIEGIQEGVVVSQAQGIITAVYSEIGDEVKSGDPLLKIDDAVPALNLEQAREQMENAEITLNVQESLSQRGGASQAELLRARSSYRGAQALFEISLKAYEDTTLRSPIDGVLAWRAPDLAVGNYLPAGQAVYRLADLSGIRVSVSVGERQIGLIEAENKAIITVPAALGFQEIEARVAAVSAAGDMATGSFLVILEAANPEGSGLRAGMAASVTIMTSDPREGLIVPASAVVNREGKSYVFTEDEGLALPVEISPSSAAGDRLLVQEDAEAGLMEGMTLIVTGLSVLKPGDPVTISLRDNREENL